MKTRFLIYLCLGSIIASLYGFNFILQLLDPRRTLPPDGFFKNGAITWGHVVQNNRFGFREREFSVPKPTGTYRVMVVGDSITWGPGLSTGDRYTGQLENLLRKENPNQVWEVLNFGINGFNTLNERDVIKNLVKKIDPNVIVVGFCINDPQPKGQDYTAEKEEFLKIYGRYFDTCYFAFDTFGLGLLAARMEQAIYGILEKIKVLPHWSVGLDRTYNVESQEWKDFVAALAEIKKISDHRKLATPIFAVLISPISPRKPSDFATPGEMEKKILAWCHQAAETARSLGFQTVEYTDEFITRFSDKIMTVNKVDGHPSAELNRLYAQKLFHLIQHTN